MTKGIQIRLRIAITLLFIVSSYNLSFAQDFNAFAYKQGHKITLTKDEQAWIKAHPKIRLGVDPDWAPIEYFDQNGEYRGIISDYVNLINARLGLTMELVTIDNWPDILNSVARNEIDVFPGIAITAEREEVLIFANPYLSTDYAIMSRISTPEIKDLSELESRVVSVNEGFSSHRLLEERYPDIPLLPLFGTKEILQSVIDKKSEAAIVEISTATTIIQSHRMFTLKMDRLVLLELDSIGFAVRKEWPELVPILNKGIASITDQERESIKQKWLAVPIQVGYTTKNILLVVLIVITIMGIILLFFIYWNRKLKKEAYQRKKAEQALKESEDKFRGIYEQSPIAIEIYDKEGKLIDVNNETLKLFGIDDVKHVLGFDLFNDPNLSKDRILKLKKGEPVFISTDFDFEIIKSLNLYPTSRDGIMYMDMHAIPLLSNKETIGYLVQIIETSERKQAELVLKEREDRFRQLIKNSFDMIILIDSDGIQHYVSESCVKILGYKAEELTGFHVFEKMIHPEDQESAQKAFLSIIENKSTGGTQYRHLHKDGSWVYLEAYGTNQIDNPAIKAIVLNVRDVTERKREEHIIKDNEIRLKELNSTKDKFFSIIAHDLKSPFNGILGFSELLIKRVRKSDYKGVDRYAEIINMSSKKAMELLSNLMEWSRSQTGRLEFNPEFIDVVELINSVTELLKTVAENKSINITLNIPHNLILNADKAMIETVLRNIISNAIKFTQKKGVVIISAEEKENIFLVTVKDNGIGIEKDNLEKLFRIDGGFSSSGTENEQGTGLGLILCKDFIEKHNGEIWVESELEKGSIFYFTLPKIIL